MTGNRENQISNFQLLKQLASELNGRLAGFCLEQCYTINKNEIVFSFSKGSELCNLKGYFGEQSFVFLSEKAMATTKHHKIVFQVIEGKRVIGCQVHFEDRSFRIEFEDGLALVFMMYGRNGNALLFKDNVVIDLFRTQFEKHKALVLNDFKVDDSALANPGTIAVIKEDKNIILSLSGADSDHLLYSGTDVIKALNQYARQYFYEKNFEGLRHQKLSSLNSKTEKATKQLNAAKLHLQHLENDSNYKHLADIIMANLHSIPIGSEKVTLFDFYNNAEIQIQLKRGISPQAWAEKLYRKSKNQQIEKQKTIEKIQHLEQEMLSLENERTEFESLTDFKEMKQTVKTMEKENNSPELPFRHFVEGEYDIYVGKNATSNDELTFGFSHKEDLWLHARDVSGSHVIVKHKENNVFPKPVIERAAQIAAYYSKSKGSIMSPVIYTLRKFVRKPKGAAHGAVICEKEKMIMVAPGLGL